MQIAETVPMENAWAVSLSALMKGGVPPISMRVVKMPESGGRKKVNSIWPTNSHIRPQRISDDMFGRVMPKTFMSFTYST